MFLINGERAILRKYNRKDKDNMYDDMEYKDIPIKVCEYNVEEAVRFGIYTTPEAKGYYQVPRYVDIKEGDQIIFIGNYFDKENINRREVRTVIEIQHEHLFNRKEVQIAVVK